jgi:Xaa-Pro aminopeptidase
MKEFFIKNRENLLSKLSVGDMAILFSGTSPQSTADSHYDFRPDKNFYYLTGTTREEFILVLTKLETKTEAILFTEKPDYDIEKWVGRKLTVDQAKEASGIDDIKFLPEFETWLNRSIYSTKFNRVYLDLPRMKFDGEMTAGMLFAEKIKKNYADLEIKNLHKFMSELRMIKTDFEVDEIKKALGLTQMGLENVMNTLKPGDREYVAESEFRYTIRKNGADTNAFPTIAASGGNAVILHYVENDQIMQDGDLILMDLGAQYKQYASDITRTYPVNGKYSDRQKTLYNIVLKANEEVIKMMKPGVEFAELNKKCSAVLSEELIKIGLIKEAKELSKYYYHGVSHFMGLDVHDLGFRDAKLEPGMIFTVEPGLYVAEENIGIRIEDDILITEDGYVNLSKDIIKSVEDIEAFMSK